MSKFWCDWQGEDDQGVFCLAHWHEGRILNCPYSSPEDREKAEYPCSDYRPLVDAGKTQEDQQ